MKGKWVVFALLLVLLAPGWAGAVSKENFDLDTTKDLIVLCTAPETDPYQREAVGVCVGYLVGSYHYHLAEYGGQGKSPLVCPPDPLPPRKKVLKMFLAWVEKHPEYMDEDAVETWFRFLTETFPCKK